MNEPPHPVIAHTKVRHVGDQVALIVAESVKEAKDALELIEVDYDVLPACVDTATAADPEERERHESHGKETLHDLIPSGESLDATGLPVQETWFFPRAPR